MDKVIKNVISQDMNGVNINQITKGNCTILLYEQLLKYDNIIDAIGKTGNLILLFPTVKDNQNTGHWIAILYNKERN